MIFSRFLITKKTILIISSFIATFILLSIFNTNRASAAYDGGRIIDNSVFLDANSMSMQEIQNFLVARGSGIATRSFVLNCYGPTSQERQLYTAAGAPCDQTVPASNIIYYASQIYGVSPKAVLATLQKEQSLITSPNPTDWQINQAMGYACPTSGQCAGNSTFFYQIDSGVWVLRYHYERARGNMTWWSTSTTWTCGTQKNLYSPNLYPSQNVNFFDEDGVQYRTHFLANAATSAFYCYTPHAYNNPQGLYGRAPYGTVGRYYSGSYNFVYYYELWFGSTQNANYSWSLVSQSVFTNEMMTVPAGTTGLVPESKIYASIKVRNTGNQAWSNTGPNPVRFGTVRPLERISVFCDTTWLSCSRPTSMVEPSVAPGDIATFNFWLKAPLAGAQTSEYFAPVVEGLLWMSDIGLFYSMTSQPAQFSWQMTNQYVYTDDSKTIGRDMANLRAGEKIYVGFTARNTGNVTWLNNGTNPIRVGTLSPIERSSIFALGSNWLGASRPSALMETSVPPGGVGTFEFWLTVPSSPGTYNERFGLVAEGRGWLNDIGLSYYARIIN